MTTIVLVHGIARFDELPVALGWRKDLYFNGIADHLRAHGFQTAEPVLDFAAASDVRSRALAQAIRGLGPVHIIAHSMGGLDARRMLVSDADAAASVRSLTTIGTPHRGTSFADFGLANGGKEFTEFVRRATRLSLQGFHDLTTDACRRFNEDARGKEAANHVKYRAVSASEGLATTFGPLKFSFGIIAAHEGDNDGLVSVASQRWSDTGLVGTKRISRIAFPLPADHLNEVGWWDPAEAAAFFSPTRALPHLYTARVRDFYLELARLAAAEG